MDSPFKKKLLRGQCAPRLVTKLAALMAPNGDSPGTVSRAVTSTNPDTPSRELLNEYALSDAVVRTLRDAINNGGATDVAKTAGDESDDDSEGSDGSGRPPPQQSMLNRGNGTVSKPYKAQKQNVSDTPLRPNTAAALGTPSGKSSSFKLSTKALRDGKPQPSGCQTKSRPGAAESGDSDTEPDSPESKRINKEAAKLMKFKLFSTKRQQLFREAVPGLEKHAREQSLLKGEVLRIHAKDMERSHWIQVAQPIISEFMLFLLVKPMFVQYVVTRSVFRLSSMTPWARCCSASAQLILRTCLLDYLP